MNEPAPTEKKKRTLPAALAKFKFQKGHKRATKPAVAPGAPVATPAASQPAITAANAGAATVRRVGMIDWLWSRRVAS